MDAVQFARLDRHVECWDARSGTAWMVAEASIEHERPAVRLAVVMHRIAQVRGSPIACCGTVSLHGRGPEGQRRVLEADQTIYLDAAKANTLRSPVPGGSAGGRPDIVLEVDHTTDVRRRKLGMYESWGIPEVWVEVPDAPAPSRAKSRVSGLAIYLFDANAKRYRAAPASAALPGWSAAEIHLALNEPRMSENTWAASQARRPRLGRKGRYRAIGRSAAAASAVRRNRRGRAADLRAARHRHRRRPVRRRQTARCPHRRSSDRCGA